MAQADASLFSVSKSRCAVDSTYGLALGRHRLSVRGSFGTEPSLTLGEQLKVAIVKEIRMPAYQIVIQLDEKGGGTITSGLKEFDEEPAPVDGIESLILACACEGIDVESPAFLCAIETAIDACLNHE
jgi:hypothetical protein